MTHKFLSCNGPGLGPAQLITGLLHRSSALPDGFPFTDLDVVLTYQGRYAINLICQILHIGVGDEIIVPAYNCGAEIDPFVCTGAKVLFYRVDNRATIDKEDIIRRVTPATKLIYITHFFGWPQEIGDLADWCKKKGLFLVEDCAQSLFSNGYNNAIGHTGDAAIYSLVKSLAVADGGALVLKNQDLFKEIKSFRYPPYRHVFRNSLPLLKKWFMNKNKTWQRYECTRNLLNKSWFRRPVNQNNKRRDLPQSNYFDAQKIGWSISGLSKGILSQINPYMIFEARRRNYQLLHNSLVNIPSIRLLFDDLPDNVCPLSFPVFVKDRNHWLKSLESRGIPAGGWPSYHRDFDWKEFPEAIYLKDNLLTLPVDQGLSAHHMEYMVECVKLIAEGK